MDANLTLDIGKNITELIEKLATALGTTSANVFPWYVQQVYLESLFYVVTISLVFLTTCILFVISIKKSVFEENGINRYGVYSIFLGIIGIIFLITICVVFPRDIANIINPQYQALQKIIADMSGLIPK